MDHNEDQEEYFEDENPFEKRRGYQVGYGKPPRQHRFKKGNKAASGKRRCRKEKSLTRTILKIAGERVAAIINGKHLPMTRKEALIRQMFDRAMRSTKDGMTLVQLVLRIEEEAPYDPAEQPTITVEFVHTRPVGLPGSEFEQPQQPKLGKWKPQPD